MDRVPAQPDLARPAFSPTRMPDWSQTRFGPVESWPQSLRTAASMVLGSTLPMFLGWGPDFLVLYNDAYGEILGDRHPCQGRPAREIWADAWDRIGPNARRAMAGETLFFESEPRLLRRGGREEMVWLTFSYTPVIGESGLAAGVVRHRDRGQPRRRRRTARARERGALPADRRIRRRCRCG